MEEIDHEYTHEIVCPYCGAEKSDSWEYNLGDGDIEKGIDCDLCGGVFNAECQIDVTYSTFKSED